MNKSTIIAGGYTVEDDANTKVDNPDTLTIELIILGITILIMIFAQLYKTRLENTRRRNLSNFSQYEDYRRLQSAESNQSS